MLTLALACLFAIAATASLIVLVDTGIRGRNAFRSLTQVQARCSTIAQSATITQLAPYRPMTSRRSSAASVRCPAPLRAAA